LIVAGFWPTKTLVFAITNDLIWWPIFTLYLVDIWPVFRMDLARH
jgi:hypothetical protein